MCAAPVALAAGIRAAPSWSRSLLAAECRRKGIDVYQLHHVDLQVPLPVRRA